jgi:hypothetical protein
MEPINDAAYPGDRDHPILLFDESTRREIGRISEDELKVLQDGLEEEGPQDRDYWINPDAIDMLASRAGATEHLITVLRQAVGENEDGMEIAFQREGEDRQSFGQSQ